MEKSKKSPGQRRDIVTRDDQPSGQRPRKAGAQALGAKIKSVGILAAVIGALGAIVAALIAGFFVTIQPLVARIVDEYWNRTDDVQVADVRFAVADGQPTIDVVLRNPTKTTQSVISVEIGLKQEGLPLALIAKTLYRLNGTLLTSKSVGGRSSGVISGGIESEDRIVYPFEGTWESHLRGAWTVLLAIPVRETLASGESREMLFVMPQTIKVVARSGDWMTSWLPFVNAPTSDAKYLAGPESDEFTLWQFLNGRGATDVRIRAKRGDGKMGMYEGSIQF